MPFGKYGPKRAGGALDIEDVPANYLLYLSEQDWIDKWPEVEEYIVENKQGIEKQIADGNGEI